MRTLITVLVLGLLATACGEAGPLEHVGEASARWVTAVTVSTTEPVVLKIVRYESGTIVGIADDYMPFELEAVAP
jgi:hypothetical protein